ncbi:MAG: ABC transporter permease [Armatimonadetes bacterium]|nr:ABC transporter permease [Armatimonadota bacterium]
MRQRLRKDPLLLGGMVFLVLLVLFAVFGPHLRHDPFLQNGGTHLPPGGDYWLGTDTVGRDTFSRLAYGARLSLYIGLVVQSISLGVGILMGVLGTFSPRWLGSLIMRFTDVMFAFPDILLAILIITVVGMGVKPVIVALSITAWPAIARLVKTQLATLKDREFVVAARASGASTAYLVFKHVLPQLWGILMAVTMVELAGTILSESTLSFLGIGIQAPDPSWGSMIQSARMQMNSYPMELLYPCVILSLTIFALNFVGDGLRAALDPKSS